LFGTALDFDRTAIRWLRFCGLLLASWTVMTFTHEIGHVVGGWLSGATLVDLELMPWQLPYSLHQPDPNPLVTLWSGPLLGILIPLGIATLLRRQFADFIANFCLLANGTYIGVAWLSSDRFLDTNRLLDAGASPISIALYCAVTIGFGYHRFRRDCIDVLGPKANKPERMDNT
jgi:hypothetical protein